MTSVYRIFLFVAIINLFAETAVEAKPPKIDVNNENILIDDNNFSYTECTPQSFANGNRCALSCSLTPSEPIQYYSAQFISERNEKTHYRTPDYMPAEEYGTSLNEYPAKLDINVTKEPTSFSISYEMGEDEYRAGFYVCSLVLRNLTTRQPMTYEYVFQIDEEIEGVPLKQKCQTHQECMTYGAQCYQGYCQCMGYYYVQDYDSCLPRSENMLPCVSSSQCHRSDNQAEDLYCYGGICRVYDYNNNNNY